MNARIAALALVLGVAACTPLAPPLHPTRSAVQVKDVVKVALTEIDNDALAFKVWNYGTQPLEVERDAIVLETDHGPRRPHSEGPPTYPVSPGTSRELSVRFDWTGLRNTTTRVLFDNAIRLEGKPLDISAIEIRVE